MSILSYEHAFVALVAPIKTAHWTDFTAFKSSTLVHCSRSQGATTFNVLSHISFLGLGTDTFFCFTEWPVASELFRIIHFRDWSQWKKGRALKRVRHFWPLSSLQQSKLFCHYTVANVVRRRLCWSFGLLLFFPLLFKSSTFPRTKIRCGTVRLDLSSIDFATSPHIYKHHAKLAFADNICRQESKTMAVFLVTFSDLQGEMVT